MRNIPPHHSAPHTRGQTCTIMRRPDGGFSRSPSYRGSTENHRKRVVRLPFIHFISTLHKCSPFPGLEELNSVKPAEEFDQLRDEPGPTRLVARTQARAVIPVKVFVEQQIILPVRIGLKFLRPTVHRPPA